jgi:hypothetical protein
MKAEDGEMKAEDGRWRSRQRWGEDEGGAKEKVERDRDGNRKTRD